MARRTARSASALVLVAVALLALPGCSSGGRHTTLTVLAASSLTDAFTELGNAFEKSHPGVTVRVVPGSSATLAEQVVEGAPGDVLATADERTMRSAGDNAVDPSVFTRNELVLAVPADNPADITSLSDLDRPGVDYVACVPEAPCGALAQKALAGITAKPASLEVDVRAVLTKLEASEADAGLVYRTDVTASKGSVTAIDLPTPVTTQYWISRLSGSSNTGLADEFVTFTESSAGQSILKGQGFTGVG